MNFDIQLDRLIELGVHNLAGVTAGRLRDEALPLRADSAASNRCVVAVHPSFVSARALTGLLWRAGKPGFVVEDMDDLEAFVPAHGIRLPPTPLYLIHDVERGDDKLNWSPEEALAAFTSAGRTPLTITEGISWLLQQPDMLEPNRCFMCIGSRKPNGRGGLDARTPAIWISGGTGRDGRDRRDAPKVGWCWARNRHTWLGFASASHRSPATLHPAPPAK